AGAARGDAAAELGAGQSDDVAEDPEKRHVARHVDREGLAVDGEFHGYALRVQAGINRPRNARVSDPISAQWSSSAKCPLSIGWNSISGMSAGGITLSPGKSGSLTPV